MEARSRSVSGSSLNSTGGGIPLIDFNSSREPSPLPYARNRSAAVSEDEDDGFGDDFAVPESLRPLVGQGSLVKRGKFKSIFTEGGLESFLNGTWLGWQVSVVLGIIWVGGCSFGVLLMNRFILWSKSFQLEKFPYPLTTTLIELGITHLLLLFTASFTRTVAAPFRKLGFHAAVAPAYPYSPSIKGKARWLRAGSSGGIAGGGILEFDLKVARQCLPLVIVFVLKLVLSNISFAYAVVQIYTLSRLATVPLTLLLTTLLTRTSHSLSTLSTSLIATLNLLIASIRPGVRVTWESVLAGVSSSLFVALYPLLLVQTHEKLTATLVPHGESLTASEGEDAATAAPGQKEASRAYWRLLHYTSLMSMIALIPIVLISGELSDIRHNCYFLDVPWFWFLCGCGGLGSWAVFISTPLFTKSTSPLATSMLSLPRGTLQLLTLGGHMPVHSWVGVSLCWASCAWFVLVRRGEARKMGQMAMEGR
ncbi:hypothetical protein K402DRAFT_342135 [Aulographum hederae CBS 113979]|uniref:GDP-mannose transporter n=1 Tax=Aulographum hederae CBS 113979 TaxID=1176131 RepID=A0A6G1GLH5_9PEZI|nr:hypothetical protein K402DRAFT_342135 [Aulographum hederae CBS 113979]